MLEHNAGGSSKSTPKGSRNRLTRFAKKVMSGPVSLLAVVVILIFGGVVGVQAYQIHHLQNKTTGGGSSPSLQSADNPSPTNPAPGNVSRGATTQNSPQPSTKKSTTSTSTIKPYVAGVCSHINIVPYQTSYQIKYSLTPGAVETLGGTNGYTSTCTPDSNGDFGTPDAVIPPSNKVIYVGDGGTSLSVQYPPRTQYPTSDLATSAASSICAPDLTNGGGNIGYQMCISSLMHYYGY